MKNRRGQFHFARRDLQISITLIVLWSFVTAIFLAFIINEVKDVIVVYELGDSTKFVLMLLVFVGYIVALAVLTSIFTKRFIGPFSRFERELEEIIKGRYGRRLSLRKKDDPYLRAFIEKVNRVLDILEEKSSSEQ